MAGMQRLASMEYDDDEILDRMLDMQSDFEPPEYPVGLQFSMRREDLEQIVDGEFAPDHSMRFSAIGVATSVMQDREDCRIEMLLEHMAGPDGKFVEIENPPSIALTGPECEKLEVEQECERGDWLHLIGTMRVERTHDHEFGSMVTLQIVEMAVEDESEESRGEG